MIWLKTRITGHCAEPLKGSRVLVNLATTASIAEISENELAISIGSHSVHVEGNFDDLEKQVRRPNEGKMRSANKV